jgi:hypothetical protein
MEKRGRPSRLRDEHLIQIARMGGLISTGKQAKLLGFQGYQGVKSVWHHRFGFGPKHLHGMRPKDAAEILKPGFPTLIVGRAHCHGFLRIVLWCEMKPWLLEGLPKFFTEAIAAMAQFQCWLYQTDNPRQAIEELMKQMNEEAKTA